MKQFPHQKAYIRVKVFSELKSEVSQNFLGYAWWLLEPMLVILSFYLVFQVLLQRGEAGYIYYLLVGVVTWQWFAGGINKSYSSIMTAHGLVNQVYLPKYLIPLTKLLSASYRYLFVFAVLLLFFALTQEVTIAWLYLPLVGAVYMLLIFGFGMLVAAIVPLVPDIRMLVAPLLQFTMFTSGIFYYTDSIREPIRSYFLYNPMARVISLFREILIEGKLTDIWGLVYVAGFGSIVLCVGMCVLLRLDKQYPRLV